MKATARALSPLFLGVALLTFGNGLFGVLLGLRMTLAGNTATETGFVIAAYFLGFIPATLTAPAILARVGHIRGFATFAAIAAACVLALPMFPTLPVWIALRFVIGYCLAALFMSIESWINLRTENRLRGRVLGLYQAIIFVAVVIAQALVGYGDVTGFALFSVVAMFLALSLVPVAQTHSEPPRITAPSRLGLRRLFKVSPVAVAVTFGAGLINNAFSNMGAVFATGVGMDPVAAGRFIAIGTLSGLAMQWPIGWLSDRFDRRHVITAMAFGTVVASLGLCLAGIYAPAMLFVLSAFLGGISFALYAQGVAHANDYAAPDQLVAVSAGLLLANGVGALVSPIAAGFAMDRFGPSALFAFTAVMSGGLAAFCLYRMSIRAPKPVAEQAPFAPVPETTPVAAQLDPRVEPSRDEPSAP